jgi:hypothetical protein
MQAFVVQRQDFLKIPFYVIRAGRTQEREML